MDNLAKEILSDIDFNDTIVAYELEKERFYEASKNCRHYDPVVPHAKRIDDVKRNLDAVFQNMSENNPTDIINIIDNLFDHLGSQDIRGIYYLKARIANIAKSSKVTPEDLYRVRISDFCDWSGGHVQFPNGWKASMRGRDSLSKTGYEENKYCCLRFYLSSNTMTDNYPRDYFRCKDSKFWQVSGLEWVDFDDCTFNELESVFEWLNANEPICLE
jgi:hypothetical protein